jgi:hypothetical protein
MMDQVFRFQDLDKLDPTNGHGTVRFVNTGTGSPTDFTASSRKSPKVHISQPQHAQLPEHNRIRKGGAAA